MTTRPNPLRAPELLEDRTVPTVFIVNSLADDGVGVGVGDTGDLRYGINRANTLGPGTPDAPDRRDQRSPAPGSITVWL